jgi:hypothetical protein
MGILRGIRIWRGSVGSVSLSVFVVWGNMVEVVGIRFDRRSRCVSYSRRESSDKESLLVVLLVMLMLR